MHWEVPLQNLSEHGGVDQWRSSPSSKGEATEEGVVHAEAARSTGILVDASEKMNRRKEAVAY